MKVRISGTIANDFMSRAPDHLPERLNEEGTHELTADEIRVLREDAEFQADTRNGPEYMEPGLRSAYRALAKQLRTE